VIFLFFREDNERADMDPEDLYKKIKKVKKDGEKLIKNFPLIKFDDRNTFDSSVFLNFNPLMAPETIYENIIVPTINLNEQAKEDMIVDFLQLLETSQLKSKDSNKTQLPLEYFAIMDVYMRIVLSEGDKKEKMYSLIFNRYGIEDMYNNFINP
jgi:hypothetical protein